MGVVSREAELCPCGRPLHYPDVASATAVRRLVALFGEHIMVTIGARRWMVPRHFIALHGLEGGAVGFRRLAALYGWEEVPAAKEMRV